VEKPSNPSFLEQSVKWVYPKIESFLETMEARGVERVILAKERNFWFLSRLVCGFLMKMLAERVVSLTGIIVQLEEQRNLEG